MELLFSITKKDFRIDWFSGRGAGGQARNKLKNTCRLTHIASGVVSTGQSSKSRVANQREAFTGLLKNPKFKMWYNGKIMELTSKQSLEERVAKSMEEGNIRIEGRSSGKWEELCLTE